MNGRTRILLIDDDRTVRMVLRAMLEELGYAVSEASDGLEGYDSFVRDQHDLVLTDLHMPEMNGKSLIIKLFKDYPQTPIIVISGQGTIQDALDVIRLGAWDYLIKPVESIEQLAFVIDRVLDRARLIEENRSYRDNLEAMINRRTEQLQLEEERYRMLFESAHDAILILKDERIHNFNKSAQQLLGVVGKELYGLSLLDFSPLLQPDELYSDDIYAMYRQRLLNGEPQCFEWRLCRSAGDCFDAEISLNGFKSGNEAFIQALIRDTSERKQHLDELYQQAHYDDLTGLPNRRQLYNTLSGLVENLSITGGNCYLFLVNINRLQHINDTLGHSRGDELLQKISHRLNSMVTFKDALSRFIGNEFMLLVTELKFVEQAEEIAQRILGLLEPAFQIDGMELFITANIGICSYPDNGLTVDILLKNVEAAMYQARRHGDSGIQHYNQEISYYSKEFLALENRLHRAIERNEFHLHFQPQVMADTDLVVGLEALLRWTDADNVVVSPMRFIPVLEQSGLIIEVGDWVLDQACCQMRNWIDQGYAPLELSVNVSPLQFHRGHLVQSVSSVLKRYQLDPALLCLEVTEGLIMDNMEHALEIMDQLVALGVSLSIDDFGTGYSSLSYLSRMPIHEVKIDRSFIKNIPHSEQGIALVDTIIGMAEGLGLRVVAEGVETVEQRDYLRTKNCQRIQGYYYSKPVAAEQFTAFLQKPALLSSSNS